MGLQLLAGQLLNSGTHSRKSLLGLPLTFCPKNVTIFKGCEYIPDLIMFPLRAFVY